MRSRFRDRIFSISYVSFKDQCGSCADEDGTIEIGKRLKGKIRLDTEIHESLHACLPMLNEGVVNTTATDIARFLWKLGYRLKGPKV